MTDKNEGRRKLLKSFAAGSGAVVAGKTLPESWTKPIVDSVMLPAHAETTTVDSTSYWGLNVQATGFGGIEPPEEGIHGCIVVTGDMADVTFQGGNNIGRRNGVIPTDGTSGEAVKVASIPGCNVKTTKILISAISPGAITLRVTSWNEQVSGYDVTFKVGACGSFPVLDGECNN